MHIGTDSNNKFIDISNESRKAGLAVFGIKNTGKAFTLIPSFFDQDLKEKNRGATIIVDTPELAWYLYGMCKVEGRKVDILKPSINFEILNEFLFNDGWNYEECKKYYDYEKAIKEKRITIIDMEEERYGEKAVRANSMLLLQLQAAMVIDYGKKIDYSVYIDNAGNYVPYIKNLLKYGDYYGFMTTMLFKSRAEIKDNGALIDDYVRNFILLQGISFEDAKYFGERTKYKKDVSETVDYLMSRDYGQITYEILSDDTFKRVIGEGSLLEFTDEKKKEFLNKSNYWKKRFKEVGAGDHHYQLDKESKALNTKESTTYLENIEKDVLPKVKEEKVEQAEVVKVKSKEPQLNKRLKTSTVAKKPENDYSILDEFEIPDVIEDEPIEISLEDVPEVSEVEELEDVVIETPKQEEFDLTTENTNFTIGNKRRPYHKIKNRKIERSLEDFKI